MFFLLLLWVCLCIVHAVCVECEWFKYSITNFNNCHREMWIEFTLISTIYHWSWHIHLHVRRAKQVSRTIFKNIVVHRSWTTSIHMSSKHGGVWNYGLIPSMCLHVIIQNLCNIMCRIFAECRSSSFSSSLINQTDWFWAHVHKCIQLCG